MALHFYLENINHPDKSILLNEDTIKIGRNEGLHICLLSLWISKHHATIKRKGENWTIKDEDSLNGVFINKKRIKVHIQHVIEIGDMIQIGNSKDEPFCYKFQEKMLKYKSYKKEGSSIKNPGSDLAVITNLPQNLKFINASLKVPSSPLLATCSNSNSNNVDNINENTTKITSPFGESVSPKLRKNTFSDNEVRLKELEKRSEMLEEALKMEKEKFDIQAKALSKLEAKKKQVELKLGETERLKEEERRTLEQDFQKKMVMLLKKKEMTLKQDLNSKKVALKQEKEKIEKELLNKCNADQATIDKLIQSKKQLKQIINNKDAEQRLLENQLKEAKLANLQVKDVVVKTREEVLTTFADMLEMELQCSICNELFVQATTLSCSHSFCSYCIQMWLSKKNDCPFCRSAVTSQTRALVLDSYIDKVVTFFSPDMKEKRAQLVKERNAHKVPQPKSRKRSYIDSEHMYDSTEIESGIQSFLAALNEDGDYDNYYDDYDETGSMFYVW